MQARSHIERMIRQENKITIASLKGPAHLEMGLLPQEIAKIPEACDANLKQPKQLERILPIGGSSLNSQRNWDTKNWECARVGPTSIGKPGQR